MKVGLLIVVLSLAQAKLPENYDTSKRVSFAGTIEAVIIPPGDLPVCFVMTVQNSGKSEQWVVAGDTFPVLRKAGWRFGPTGHVKPNLSISVSVFLPKPKTITAQTLAAKLRESMPAGMGLSPLANAALNAGRLAQGVEVKLADGQTLPFGPPK